MEDPTKLIGSWRFERVIDDLRNGARSNVSGTCELTAENAERIHWRERGVLEHAGRELPAKRDLLLDRDDNGWHVRFEDGRYFHPWSPGETAIHHCGADLYEGVVDLGDDAGTIAGWSVTWRVHGPDKNLLIETRLSRARGCVAPR